MGIQASSILRINKKQLFRGLVFLIFLAILILRLKTFFHAPSLMIDEANVARNLAERNWLQLFQRLDYEQYAPSLFLLWVKISTLIFGMNEYALRLPSLLSFLLSLPLLYYISKHPRIRLSPATLCVVLLLYSCSHIMIFQSNAVKQYSTDALLALFWVAITLRRDYSFIFSVWAKLTWILLGTISIWLSMPIVFVFASIGLYYLAQARRQGRSIEYLQHFAVPVFFWIANFLLYFFLLLKSDAQSQYLQQYHDSFFFDHRFWLLDSWDHNWNIIAANIQTFVGKTVIVFAWVLLFVFTGVFTLIKKYRELLFLLLFPVLWAAMASFLHYYSFIPRLLLFATPLLFLLLGIGVQALWSSSRNYGSRALIFLSTLFVLLQMSGWQYFSPDNHCLMEETREALEAFHPPDTVPYKVFVNHGGAPALSFYTKYYDEKASFQTYSDFRWIQWDENIATIAENYLKTHPEYTLVTIWGHASEKDIQKEVVAIKEKGLIPIQSIEKKTDENYLVETRTRPTS
jgi:4-amino-4-deoxy-L-arabinose transferase-like glycosyltransferase